MASNSESNQQQTRLAVALFVWIAFSLAGMAAPVTNPEETPRNPARPDVVSPSASTAIAMRLVTGDFGVDFLKETDAVPMTQAIGRTPVYPGVTCRTLRTGRMSQSLEFAVTPGFDTAVITLQFAAQVSVNVGNQGELRLTTQSGERSLASPTAFQPALFEERAVAVAYRVSEEGTVTLQVGETDDTLPVVIRVPMRGVRLVLDTTDRSGAISAGGIR